MLRWQPAAQGCKRSALTVVHITESWTKPSPLTAWTGLKTGFAGAAERMLVPQLAAADRVQHLDEPTPAVDALSAR